MIIFVFVVNGLMCFLCLTALDFFITEHVKAEFSSN